MSGGNEKLTLRQQKQEEIRTGIRQQLPAMQTWDLQEGQTLQQRRDGEAMMLISRQIGMNEMLDARMQQMPLLQAKTAAAGTPEQELKPAKKSWKERREEAKQKKVQTAQMQKHTPAGDHVTYAFAKAIETLDAERNNSFPDEMKTAVSRMNSSSADHRVIVNFVSGYRKNAKGEPLNEEEARKKQQDEAFIQDYVASASGTGLGDPMELRRPHLRRITNELMSVKFSEEMFTEEYMYEHALELKKLAGQLTYFENIKKDPINRKFFEEELSQFEKDWLEACDESIAVFRTALSAQMAAHGVQESSAERYIRENALLKGARATRDVIMGNFPKFLKAGQEAQQKAVSDEVERLRKELRGEDIEPLEDTAGLQMLRELFLNEPEKYAAHKGELDRLYQQYYRAVDTLRDLTSDSAAYGQVAEQYRNAEDFHQNLAHMALQKQMEAEAQAQLIRQQMESMTDLMNYFLGGESLTEQSRALAEQEGLTEQVDKIEYPRLSGEEQRVRTTERLNKLTFSKKPQGNSGMTMNRWFSKTFKATIAQVTEETERAELFEVFGEKFSDKEKYGDAYSGSIETGSFSNADKTVVAESLVSARMSPQLIGVLAKGETTQSMTELYEKLLCTGRYRYLKAREGQQTPEGTPVLSEKETEELAGYTEEKLKQLNATFDEGMLQLKNLQYKQLCRLRDKYGRLGSQLHPEDFIARIGPEFFDETAFLQDLQQMMEAGNGKYFDYDTPEDQEYRDLANYYNAVFLIARGYTLTDVSGDTEQFTPNPAIMERSFDGLREHKEALELEKKVSGPSLSAEEEKTYHTLLQQRFGGENAYRLYGRFAPGADAPAEEEPVEEVTAELQQAVFEEITMEAQEATVEPLLREAVLTTQVQEEPQEDTRTAQQRMEDKLKGLDFNRAPERTQGLSGRQRYMEGLSRKSGSANRGDYRLENAERTRREAVLERLSKKYQDENLYGEAMGGGDISCMGNASGSIYINGLNLRRMLSGLRGAPGEGWTEEQLEGMFDKLLSGTKYRTLKRKNQAEAYTTDQIKQMDEDFLEGFQQLKQLHLTQLRRLRDKYGRFGSQLHPEDFVDRMGLEFFDDVNLDQDCRQMLEMVEKLSRKDPELAKRYFDFESNPEDREYRELTWYYFWVRSNLNSYFLNLVGEPMESLNQVKLGLNDKGMNVLDGDTYWQAVKREEAVGGDGFTPEEEEAYHKQLQERVRSGAPFVLGGRFKSEEQKQAEARAKEEALAAERIRTREEATSTYSDERSRTRRLYVMGVLRNAFGGFADLRTMTLKNDTPLTRALLAYYQGDRYSVGYTEERRRLKLALKELDNAERMIGTMSEVEKKENEKFINGIRSVKQYFEEVTNGTLEIPEQAQVRDLSRQQPEEEGSIQRGSFRNGLIRKLSRWSDQKDTPLFSHEPTVNDLKQRAVSNCYMVAATAGLVNISPETLKECIKDNGDGTVTVRLYERTVPQEELDLQKARQAEIARLQQEYEDNAPDEGYSMEQELDHETRIAELEYIPQQQLVPIYVKVSKEVPRIGGADALSAGALWMQMIEKACAAVGRNGVKGYQSLWYGEGGEFLERLLGVVPKTEYSKADGIAEEDKDTLFEGICNCHENRMVYNAGTGAAGKEDGLNAGHAYTVMGGKLVGNKRFVLLRNPYSTMSMEYRQDGTKSRTGNHLDSKSDETYGQFYMDFEEFLQKFQKVTSTDLKQR